MDFAGELCDFLCQIFVLLRERCVRLEQASQPVRLRLDRRNPLSTQLLLAFAVGFGRICGHFVTISLARLCKQD
jgi:hypothetical protein